ncbi:MAG TPA: zinc ribbon domain-containing protein [Terrimicrobiaceae bacterium]
MKNFKCTQCGHENDHTRVFCQNCGARLERTVGEEPTISGPTKVAAERRFRMRAASAGCLGTVASLVRGIISMAILAALLAVGIQMARPPDGLPPAQKINEAEAGQLFHMLQVISAGDYARSIDVSQAQANNYLASSIVPDTAANTKSWFRADFSRAFVVIKSGELDFFVEQRLFGWPIYTYLLTAPAGSSGKLSLRVTGGGIGRMPLHPRLIPLLEVVLRPVIATTSEAAVVLETADDVVLTPEAAKLNWKARKRSAP